MLKLMPVVSAMYLVLKCMSLFGICLSASPVILCVYVYADVLIIDHSFAQFENQPLSTVVF